MDTAQAPRPHRRLLAERLVFVVLPAVVVTAILGLLFFGRGSDGVPGDVRAQARHNCSIASAGGARQVEGAPGFDRCVSDWIAILWD